MSEPHYPEPDWNMAPDNAWNAVFWAVNPDGRTQWFPSEPSINPRGFWAISGECFWYYGETIDLPLGCDWRLTLRRRPAAQLEALKKGREAT